jgi:hypothetical protein
MRVRVQSLHFLDDERLAAIWRRSAFDTECRDCLEKTVAVEKKDDNENEGERKPQPRRPIAKDWWIYWLRWDRKSDLGQIEIRENDYYIWANWIMTNRGLVPILDLNVFGQPLGWRLTLIGEDSRICAAGESISFEGKKYTLVLLNGHPMVVEEEISEEEKKKALEEARSRLDNLSAHLRKLTKRRER